MLTYLEIARRLRPRWVVWENVPGVLSSNGGRDFGSFLGALGELGYGWAYRVLDAQWCRTHGHPRAVPQRRRRVFVVGCLIERCAGDWERAAQVLFECESVQRDSAPRRTTRQGAASDAEGCAGNGGWMPNNPGVVSSVCTKWSKGTGGPSGSEHFNLVTEPTWPAEVAPTLAQSRSGSGSPGYSDQELFSQGAGNLIPQPVPFTKSKRAQSVTDDETWVDGQVNPTLSLFDQGDTRATTVAVGFNWQNGGGYGNANEGLGITVEGTGPIQRCNTPAVAFQACGDRDNPSISVSDTAFCLPANAMSDRGQAMAQAMTVRRLTARECERLQGFPDDYTLIPWRKKPAADCPDGPRYKALGNSMAVNCMAWIGERIAAVENHNAN